MTYRYNCVNYLNEANRINRQTLAHFFKCQDSRPDGCAKNPRVGQVEMIGLSLNGLGVIKRSQDDGVNDRPRRQPWMAVENEFNGRLIMSETFWCTH